MKALHDYKSGVRSGGGMAAMANVAYSLSEEEIEALAHYLAHLVSLRLSWSEGRSRSDRGARDSLSMSSSAAS